MAGVATKVAGVGLNIIDISQTVLDEYSTMMAIVSQMRRFHTASSRVGRIRSVSACENQYPKRSDFDAIQIRVEEFMDVRRVTETIAMIEAELPMFGLSP